METTQLLQRSVSAALTLMLTSSGWAQPQHPDHARVVDLSGLGATSIVVESRSGNPRTMTPGVERISVLPWQYVAARTGAAPVRLRLFMMRDAWALPVVLATADSAGIQYLLEVVVDADNGLMLRGRDDVYSGDVFVGVLNRRNRGAADPLGAPVHILVTGPVESIEPGNTVTITRMNQPFRKLSVRARSSADAVPLKFRPSFDTAVSEVPIPIIRPRLVVRVSPDRIQGLGLETADVMVRAEGLAEPGDREVALQTSAGRLEPSGLVKLNKQGIATASLRSVGVGDGMVIAESAGLAPAESNRVKFQVPGAFFLSALFGGLVGGGLRASTRGRLTSKKWFVSLGAGAATGLLIAAAGAVGINLIGFKMSARAGEAMVFVVAGAAAWFGMRLLLPSPPERSKP